MESSGTMTPINDSPVPDPNETQPLLGAKRLPTPLPVKQLAVVCYARLAEPIAYSQIFSYINQMVEELGIAKRPEDVGFYSGLVDSAFALAQLCTIYQWSRLSDKIGRKPVIFIGVAGVTIASVIFGFSKTFGQMLLARAVAGALTGNVAIIQTVVADITDETNESKAFPLPEVMWTIGCVIGPPLGGLLSHPAKNFPNTFGRVQVFRDWPYLLPCIATACITTSAALTVLFVLRESHPRIAAAKRRDQELREHGMLSDSSTTDASSTADQNSSIPSTKDLLKDRNVFLTMAIATFITFTWIAERTLFTIWLYTPIKLGGLDRPPIQIGIALAASAVLNILLNLFVFHRVQERFGTTRVFLYSAAVWPFVFVAVPIVGAVGQAKLSEKGLHAPLGDVWAGVGVIVVLEALASFCYPAFFLMVKAVSPSAHAVGSMFGLALTATGIGEALGPVLSSTVYAYSIDRQVLGGNLIWIVMFVITCVAPVLGYMVRGL